MSSSTEKPSNLVGEYETRQGIREGIIKEWRNDLNESPTGLCSEQGDELIIAVKRDISTPSSNHPGHSSRA